jgi:2-haloacid dehalogenase
MGAPERPKVATFDCYGTLVDWEGGLGTFLYALAREQGEDPPPGRELREQWEAIQFEVIQGEYHRYREVLHESTRKWCGERGYRWDEGFGEALERAMEGWQPFPDTAPALRQAREQGVRLVILSNTDRDLIAHTLKQIGVDFDAVITAQDVGAYKPADAVFTRARDELGEAPEHILHVAFGFKYDIAPAQRAGMRTAWVNRHVEAPPGDERPDHVWRDLWGLADLAGGPGPDPSLGTPSAR